MGIREYMGIIGGMGGREGKRGKEPKSHKTDKDHSFLQWKKAQIFPAYFADVSKSSSALCTEEKRERSPRQSGPPRIRQTPPLRVFTEKHREMKTATINGLPVLQATIDEQGDGMLRVSLVDFPAVESNFLAFRDQTNQKPVQMYAVADEEKRLVRGVIMRADYPIYREDEQNGKYFIVFTAETCRKMAEKYLAESRQNLVNLMHEDGSDVEGVTMVQFFLKDTANGIDPEGFEAIADGSIFGEYHVTNDEVWENIKNGTYRGFSIEVITGMEPMQVQSDREDVENFIQSVTNIFKNNSMSKFTKSIRTKLAKMLGLFVSVTTDKGVLFTEGDEDIKVGDAVFVDQDGEKVSAPDGDYTTEDGTVYTVKDGLVEAIAQKPEESTGDGAQETNTEDGDTAPKAEQESAEVQAAKQGFLAIVERFSASYDEIQRNIYEALRQAGYNCYIYECGSDYAVVEVWDDMAGKTRYYRFELQTNEDGSVVLGGFIEVKRAFVPVEPETQEPVTDPVAETQEPETQEPDANAELRSQVETLTGDVSELADMFSKFLDKFAETEKDIQTIKNRPAQSAHEAFRKLPETSDTKSAIAKLRERFDK